MTLTKFRSRDLWRLNLKGKRYPLNVAKVSSRMIPIPMTTVPATRCPKKGNDLAEHQVHLLQTWGSDL
jgi:hypothetical protein